MSKPYYDLSQLAHICTQGLILADEAIAKSHGATVQKITGFDLLPVPSGEKNKTRETKQWLEDELFKRKLGKETTLIAVGGGTTTDLVGFVASTYMRGLPLILIPTTLLGMVDASIGGKTAVNTTFGKNSLGTFYPPKATFIHTDFLHTLSEKELKNGLAEILKYGLILDAKIWEKCNRWKEELPFLIPASIDCKLKVVAHDPEEKTGLRRILNFGHTVGHALEWMSHYEMAHGEAVAMGCIAESYLSHKLGHLTANALENILNLYRNLGFHLKKIESKPFFEALHFDKKGKGRFVLIDQIGHAVEFGGEYCTQISNEKLENMIDWFNAH